MPEPVAKDHQPDMTESPESVSSSGEVSSSPIPETNEVFLGGMVVTTLLFLLLILIGTFGYFGYRLWQSAQVERSIPSIQELGEKPGATAYDIPTQNAVPTEASPAPVAQTSPASPVTTNPSESGVADLASVEVKILNGGAARGSAGTLVDILKKAGYTKAAFGNTVADYTGTTIYYGANAQATAEKIKEIVSKTYPAVTIVPAEANNKDATAALIVVILGK